MLVALAAVFLPMILDGSGRQGHVRIDMDIPPEPVFPAPERLPPLPTAAEPEAQTAPAEESGAVDTAPERPPRREAVVRSVPEEPPAAKPAPTVAPVTSGWAVQVGSFSEEPRARSVRDDLKSDGYAAFIEPFTADGTTVYRVKVGPEAERAAAEKIGERLEKERGLKVLVVSQQ